VNFGRAASLRSALNGPVFHKLYQMPIPVADRFRSVIWVSRRFGRANECGLRVGVVCHRHAGVAVVGMKTLIVNWKICRGRVEPTSFVRARSLFSQLQQYLFMIMLELAGDRESPFRAPLSTHSRFVTCFGP